MYFHSLFVLVALAAANSQPSFVVTRKPSPDNSYLVKRGVANPAPKIYEMHVVANVSNRFARTLVTSRVKNFSPNIEETQFSVVLPKAAYISEFILETGGKKYKAIVMEKNEAERKYKMAKASGHSGAHVAANARDSDRFDVTVSLEPNSTTSFLLTYEELLVRKNNQYEVILNIHPGQSVRNMLLQANIHESRRIKFVSTPTLQSGFDESDLQYGEARPSHSLPEKFWNSTFANVTFMPTVETQQKLGASLGVDEGEGLAGQLVIHYDVERDDRGGEVLVRDGYFAHFFAPKNLKPLPKQVIFVLDTSGSMKGTKLDQLKQAMKSILSQLKPADTFNIVDFNVVVNIHDVLRRTSVVYRNGDRFENIHFANATQVTPETIKLATEKVQSFSANDYTDIYTPLVVSLRLVELACLDSETIRQPLVVFLTDGQPNRGVTDPKEIISKISEMKSKMSVCAQKSSIFSLSLGEDANKNFLNTLSLQNRGFWRHIYDANDTSVQLINFYNEISTPLLTEVHFNYTSSFSNVTKTNFPVLFEGSELVVVGQITKNFPTPTVVEAHGANGAVQLTSEIGAPVARLERLWAYLTIKQILEAEVTATNRTVYEKAALDLALKYSFVTPVSSLVVEKPGWRGVVNPVAADAAFHRGKYGSRPSIPLTASHGLTVRRSRASVSSASSNFQMLQLTFEVIVSVTIRYF